MDKKKRILIVEDEASIAMDMAKLIGDAGYEVSTIVVSGEAAIEQANRDKPDLILMDIMLGGDMDGREAAWEIRKSLATPVIFVTAQGDKKQEQIARLNAPSGLGYLIKPFRKTELLNEIRRVLRSDEDQCPAVGNAHIDAQHRELMITLEEMAALIREQMGGQTHINCRKVWELVETHCADEEAILRDAGYPRLDDQLDSHAIMMARFNHIRSTCQETCKENHVDSCIENMKSVLTEHLLAEDMAFAPFLSVKGPAP